MAQSFLLNIKLKLKPYLFSDILALMQSAACGVYIGFSFSFRSNNLIYAAMQIHFFNLNALSSLFMIRIYCDVVLTIAAGTLYRLLADDLKRFEDYTPKTIFSDFINFRCNGEVVVDEITIKMKKKVITPIFKSNTIFQKSYPIP